MWWAGLVWRAVRFTPGVFYTCKTKILAVKGHYYPDRIVGTGKVSSHE